MRVMTQTNEDTVYLDYASSTPARFEVKKAMEPYWSDVFANPQSRHSFGKHAQAVVTDAREMIADVLSVRASELVFTSGATEANALAVQGYLKTLDENRRRLIITQTAHSSQKHADAGINTKKELLVGKDEGRLVPDQLATAVRSDNDLISIPYVNSEVGTIQPTHGFAANLKKSNKQGLLHVDASQAGLYLSVRPEDTGADMMTINSHKLYGPKGVGLLWVRSGTPMTSLLPTKKDQVVGDYQILRPGTPPVPLIVGFAKALELAQADFKKRAKQVSAVRDFGQNKLQNTFPEITVNGHVKHRVANNISISFPAVDHDYLATKLDKQGVIVSTASACQSGQSGSKVIKALSGNSNSALRITLGKDTKKTAIRRLVDTLENIRKTD
jgi:cysteine desulfurase